MRIYSNLYVEQIFLLTPLYLLKKHPINIHFLIIFQNILYTFLNILDKGTINEAINGPTSFTLKIINFFLPLLSFIQRNNPSSPLRQYIYADLNSFGPSINLTGFDGGLLL